jgi:hypothetical protein
VLCLVIQCSLATLSEHDHCALMCTGLGGFVACNALSQRNEDPIKASRPWDMVLLTSQSKLISSLSPNCCTSNHACTVLLNKSIAASSADAPLPWW